MSGTDATGASRTSGRRRAPVLLDLSNLVAGGALQVAGSFVDEVAAVAGGPDRERWPWLADAELELSSAVLANVTADLSGLRVTQVDAGPRARLRAHRRRPPRRALHDVSFTLFGPDYGPRRARTRVVGFADGSSFFPALPSRRPVGDYARRLVRRSVSRSRFRRADVLVVEAEHVADKLHDRWSIPRRDVVVVPNVLNAVFDDVPDGAGVDLPPAPDDGRDVPIRLCYPSRLYPHKNIDVLGPALQRLADEHDVRAQLVLTLDEREWERLDPATRAVSVTVGPLTVAQMPSLYTACDAAIFTSLIESFSITPLEAMVSGVPLVASDRDFVHEVAGESAWYVDPLDPASIAAGIARAVGAPEERARRTALGLGIARSWPSAADRARDYLDLVDDQLRRTSRNQ